MKVVCCYHTWLYRRRVRKRVYRTSYLRNAFKSLCLHASDSADVSPEPRAANTADSIVPIAPNHGQGASPDTLIERVRRRGSIFEKSISEEYLWRLADSYTRFFHQYEAAPVMIVNSENLNFVDNQTDFDLLLQRVEQMRGPREYFNRGV